MLQMLLAFLAFGAARPRRLRLLRSAGGTHAVIYSDATGKGELGLVLLDNDGHGLFARGVCPPWLEEQLHNHRHAVNQYETLAAVCALLTFGDLLRGRRVAIMIDNTSALSALVRGWSAKGDMLLLSAMFHACACNLDLSMFLEYVPSYENIADVPSRGPSHPSWGELISIAPQEVVMRFPSPKEWEDPSALLARAFAPITFV